MRIYIAAPYPLRDEAIGLMRYLEAHGHEVTSRWLRVQDDEGDESARNDLDDIDASETLLAYHPDGWHNRGTGGRHIEFGYALKAGKQMVLLGKPSGNFHLMTNVRVIETIEDL